MRHEVGDQMIVHLTALSRVCKRASDVLARIGGEEFALLLPETDLAQAQLVAGRLRRAVVENLESLALELFLLRGVDGGGDRADRIELVADSDSLFREITGNLRGRFRR